MVAAYEVRAELIVPQTSGATYTVDMNEGGVSILSTKLTIENGERLSTDAPVQPVLSDRLLTKGTMLSFDIDQIGDGTAKGPSVTIVGYQVSPPL